MIAEGEAQNLVGQEAKGLPRNRYRLYFHPLCLYATLPTPIHRKTNPGAALRVFWRMVGPGGNPEAINYLLIYNNY